MTGNTDPIAAARALLEPLTGYTPGPWVSRHRGTRKDVERGADHFRITTGLEADDPDAVAIVSVLWRSNRAENAALIAAAPDLRDMVATLADALEAERADAEKWREAAGAHHVAAMREAEKWIAVSAERDELRAELAKTLLQTGDLKIALAGAQAQVALGNLLAEARLEGWRAGREAAAEICDDTAMRKRDPAISASFYAVAIAIRALPEPKEASHD
jgi:hypothetical protein